MGMQSNGNLLMTRNDQKNCGIITVYTNSERRFGDLLSQTNLLERVAIHRLLNCRAHCGRISRGCKSALSGRSMMHGYCQNPL